MDGKLVLELKEKAESELRGDVQSFNPEEAAVLALCAAGSGKLIAIDGKMRMDLLA
jgi:hypothetical protein